MIQIHYSESIVSLREQSLCQAPTVKSNAQWGIELRPAWKDLCTVITKASCF